MGFELTAHVWLLTQYGLTPCTTNSFVHLTLPPTTCFVPC